MKDLEIPAGRWWDWEVMSWSRGVLVLAGGNDLTYHHSLELHFHDVAYVQCPASFHHPAFRTPTDDERRLVERQSGSAVPVVVAFDHDEKDDDGRLMSGLVGAHRVEVVTGTVFRYGREELRPGERLAPWVSPPSSFTSLPQA